VIIPAEPPRAVRLAMRAWTRGRADRIIRARLASRAAIDAWLARTLPRDATEVVAPTGAAWRTFAVAERRGIPRVLIMDMPCLRQLHVDLDRAARALPHRGFLRRYRADRDALVRQESEWVLASKILVRGEYARGVVARAGVSAEIVPLPCPPIAPRLHRPGRAVLLAGLAAARNGVDAAIDACAALGLELRGRTGEGAEAGVVPARGLDEIGVVIAPAWCESYAPELAAACAAGIPVIATRAAAAFEPVIEIAPGDSGALAAAIARSLEDGGGAGEGRVGRG
jgi:hypothetical protein